MKKYFFSKWILLFLIYLFATTSCKQNNDANSQNKLNNESGKKVSLLELKIDDEKVKISSVIDLGNIEKDRLKIECKKQPEDAVLTFKPKIQNSYWVLEKEGKNELEITVSKGSVKSIYVIKANKIKKEEPKPLTLISEINILGGRVEGNAQEMSDENLSKLLKGEKNVVLEIIGASFDIMVASEREKWTGSFINDKAIESDSSLGYKSAIFDTIKLKAVGETVDVKIKVIQNDK